MTGYLFAPIGVKEHLDDGVAERAQGDSGTNIFSEVIQSSIEGEGEVVQNELV
jgi:hypothetical protein